MPLSKKEAEEFIQWSDALKKSFEAANESKKNRAKSRAIPDRDWLEMLNEYQRQHPNRKVKPIIMEFNVLL